VSWNVIHSDRFASCVVVSPAAPRTLVLGTTDHPYHDACRAPGVFLSTDGGTTWHAEVDGLTCTNISCIACDPHDSSRVYVGTGGNGAFAGDLAGGHRPAPNGRPSR
jgi:hypothetical protein